MYQPLDGPSAQSALSLTTTAVVEAKVGASALDERKNLTIQARTGDVYIYFGDEVGTVPSVATMQANGLILYKTAKDTYEASFSQKIFLLAVNAATTVILVERA